MTAKPAAEHERDLHEIALRRMLRIECEETHRYAAYSYQSATKMPQRFDTEMIDQLRWARDMLSQALSYLDGRP